MRRSSAERQTGRQPPEAADPSSRRRAPVRAPREALALPLLRALACDRAARAGEFPAPRERGANEGEAHRHGTVRRVGRELHHLSGHGLT